MHDINWSIVNRMVIIMVISRIASDTEGINNFVLLSVLYVAHKTPIRKCDRHWLERQNTMNKNVCSIRHEQNILECD